jgi:hypothetical protein
MHHTAVPVTLPHVQSNRANVILSSKLIELRFYLDFCGHGLDLSFC